MGDTMKYDMTCDIINYDETLYTTSLYYIFLFLNV